MWHLYLSNDIFHCNNKSCVQKWQVKELEAFREVPFGESTVSVPEGAESFLGRVYGDDWNTMVRPHQWASQSGGHLFEPYAAATPPRMAQPVGPLVLPVVPAAPRSSLMATVVE